MWLPDCSEGLEDRPNLFTIHPKGQALETMRGLALALMRHWTPHWRRSRRTREVSAGWTSITVNSRSESRALKVRTAENRDASPMLPPESGGAIPGLPGMGVEFREPAWRRETVTA